MDFNIFVLSTMTSEMTSANFRKYDLDYSCIFSGGIQKIHWPRKLTINVKLWCAEQHPVSAELMPSLLPFMDACIIWYHDHSPLSCLKVSNAVSEVTRYTDNIWLLGTTTPVIHQKHASRIQKSYNRYGFLRPCLTKPLDKSLEIILKNELTLKNSLYSF